MNWKFFVLVPIFFVACHRHTPPPVTVSVQDSDQWQELVADFSKIQKQGSISPETCQDMASRFEEISKREQFAPGLYNAGIIWQQCDQQDEAIRLFQAANRAAEKTCQSCKGYPPALIRLGAIAYSQDQHKRAQSFFQQARQSDRRSPEAYINLAVLAREGGDFQEAQQNLRRALAVDPNHMIAFAQMAQLYLELSEKNRKMIDIAELVCQQATSRAKELKTPPRSIAPIHNIWGIASLNKGDVVSAAHHFDRARKLLPESFEAHMNYGAVNLSFRGYKAAESAFRKALGIDPQSYDAHLSLGAALRGLGQFEGARKAYEKAMDLNPERPDAHYNLGVLRHDFETGTTNSVDDQARLLGLALQSYKRVLTICGGNNKMCLKRNGENTEDLREIVGRRIEACDLMLENLNLQQ